jgi:hypothetical protein
MLEFRGFPKLSRLNREVVVTEKIDGTNAQVFVVNGNELGTLINSEFIKSYATLADNLFVIAGSRNRWIRVGDDNFGFAGWVRGNAQELVKLREGQHFGEWWGQGIQRGYGLTERRFSLFNTGRWLDNPERPSCCSVVPLLWAGKFSDLDCHDIMDNLAFGGSRAAEGFQNPEGIVVFQSSSGTLNKMTFEHDGGKWSANQQA